MSSSSLWVADFFLAGLRFALLDTDNSESIIGFTSIFGDFGGSSNICGFDDFFGGKGDFSLSLVLLFLELASLFFLESTSLFFLELASLFFLESLSLFFLALPFPSAIIDPLCLPLFFGLALSNFAFLSVKIFANESLQKWKSLNFAWSASDIASGS